jgi:hypothetical protein
MPVTILFRIFCFPFCPKPEDQNTRNYDFTFFYGCKTWSLTISEEHRLGVCENRELRKTFGPKCEEGAERWRRLHNGELHNLYNSADIISVINSRMIWAEHVACMRDRRCIHLCWFENTKGRDHSEDLGLKK